MLPLLLLVAFLAAGAWLALHRRRPEPADLRRADDAQRQHDLRAAEVVQEVEATAFSHGPHVP